MIVGGKIISAEIKKKKDERATGLSLNVNIKNVEVKNDILEIEYEYVANYEEDVGILKINGIVQAKEANFEKIANDWKKTKKLPDSFAEELLNAINFACSVNGTLIARAVNLEPPMLMPKIQIGKENGKAM